MKVLHVLQNYEPSKGGTQFLFKNVSEYLVKNYPYEVDVYTTNSYYDPGSAAFKKISNIFDVINEVKIKRFGFSRINLISINFIDKIVFKIFGCSLVGLHRFRSGPWSVSLRRAIINSSCDVICASSSPYFYMNYPIYRMKYTNAKPFVFMGAIHFDDENNISLPKYVLKRIVLSEKYIANTSFEKDCLIKLGVKPDKINVIGCGVNVNQFRITKKEKAREKLGLKNNEFVIGYVGRFAKNKDIGTLISAFNNSYRDNWRLILAGGSNSNLTEIMKLVNDKYCSIADRISFILDFEEILKEQIYSSLDLFVSPSYSESFGIVFLEAWASKLPVIGTEIGAIKSVVSNGIDGMLFPVSNEIELANLLSYYYQNINVRQIHGISGFNKIIQNYSWEIVTEKYRETYIEAINIFNSKI